MEIKTLSQPALKVIENYLNFQAGPGACSIPYYNNRTAKTRAALRTHIGKGSPEDIKEELETLILKNKIDSLSFTDESLKKLLVDNGLGIECSGFCYHVLEAESQSRGHGTISKKITFINCNGFIGQIRCSIRPIENCDVETFADDKNSRVISTKDVLPGDIITMTPDLDGKDRNHILIIKEVHYNNSIPQEIIYSHSIAYPEDGVYGTGVRDGQIQIKDPNKPIIESTWIEGVRYGDTSPLFIRAKRSKTEIRRLNWF